MTFCVQNIDIRPDYYICASGKKMLLKGTKKKKTKSGYETTVSIY
ncbi:ISCpe5, transposase, partial [human gut metagenome]